MKKPRLDRALGALYGEPTPPAELTKLRGDASTRRYYRAHIDSPKPGLPARLIVMELPDDAFASDEGGAQPETTRLPFLEVAALLEARELPVPRVYAEDLPNGVVLLEDLGDMTLYDALDDASLDRRERLYAAAVDLLARMHERCSDLPEDSVVSKRRYDRTLLDWELDHFREWGLEALFGELAPDERTNLGVAFSRISDEIEGMPQGFVHRDYQSKNLMLGKEDELRLIDFQDALLGPRVYDLVALLCDSYVALDERFQQSMIERYAAARRIDAETLEREFWWVALHRKLKDAGRFVYIDRVRRNPDFLQWFPQSLVYVGRAVRRVGQLSELERVLGSKVPGFPHAVEQPASTVE